MIKFPDDLLHLLEEKIYKTIWKVIDFLIFDKQYIGEIGISFQVFSQAFVEGFGVVQDFGDLRGMQFSAFHEDQFVEQVLQQGGRIVQLQAAAKGT
jgi:hypothetical protein